MAIQTNTDNRKAMVEAIAEHMGQERQYAGAPSFNYTIGSITVAKDGSITGSDVDLRALLPFLMEQGYVEADAQGTEQEGTASEETTPDESAELDSQLSIQELVQENPDRAPSKCGAGGVTDDEPQADDGYTATEQSEIDSVVITLGNVNLTPLAATNLLFSLYTEQYLLNRAFGKETLSISESLVTRIQEHPVATMDGFLSITGKAVESGELRGVDFGAGTFAMTFPADAADPESRAVYVQLMHKLIKFAITATRVTPKLLKPESEKYYLHSWLLRLGCGGSDFKALRKRLLSGLDGYCAFPDEERAQRHKDRYKEIRRKAREGSKGSEGRHSTVSGQSSNVDEINEEAEAV